MVKMQIVIEKLFPRKRKRARIKSRTSYVNVVRFVGCGGLATFLFLARQPARPRHVRVRLVSRFFQRCKLGVQKY